MRVYDIIKEDGVIIDPSTGKPFVPVPPTPRSKLDPRSWNMGALPKVKRPTWSTKEGLLNYVKTTASRSPITRQPLSTTRLKLLGNYLRISQWFNYYDFAVVYWKQADVVDEMVKAGPDAKNENGDPIGLSADDGQVAKRLLLDELALKLVSGEVITRIIAMIIRIIPFARWGSRGVGALISIMTGGLAVPAAVGEMLAIEAVAMTLQKWLNTNDGQAVIKNCVLYMIDPTLKIFWEVGPKKLMGEFKTISDQGGKALDVNPVTGGTPTDELVNKAGKAVVGAADTGVNAVTKGIDKAAGTNLNKGYQDAKADITKQIDKIGSNSGDDTLSSLGGPKDLKPVKGDGKKIGSTTANPEDPELTAKEKSLGASNKGTNLDDPINLDPAIFKQYYGFDKPSDPTEIKRRLKLD
jgi:hypothetical protein